MNTYMIAAWDKRGDFVVIDVVRTDTAQTAKDMFPDLLVEQGYSRNSGVYGVSIMEMTPPEGAGVFQKKRCIVEEYRSGEWLTLN